jgi:hypothetical protein
VKTVSTQFSNTITNPQIQVIRQVSYKRRYWVTAGSTVNITGYQMAIGDGLTTVFTVPQNNSAIVFSSGSYHIYFNGVQQASAYSPFSEGNTSNPSAPFTLTCGAAPLVGVIVTCDYSYVVAANGYIWESNWTALPETQVIGVSPITAQLDTQTENEFQVSNATITLINFQNQWVLSNPQSIFGPDSGSPTYGYVPNWTKFQINAGLVYAGGTTELVTLFTGIATDFNFNSTDSQVQVTVSGEQAFLTNSPATVVSNTSTLENIGTGNGTNKAFNTAHMSVGIIQGVYLAGVLQTPGTAYTLSNLSSPTTVATITFITAPGSGVAVTCTYIYWLSNQKLETLVAALATAAGIPTANQQISPVSFPNSIINSHTYQTQTDWQSGTLSAIDTTTTAGNILPDYTDPLASQTVAWFDFSDGGTPPWGMPKTASGGTWSYGTSGLQIKNTSNTGMEASVYKAYNQASGRWVFTWKEIGSGGLSFLDFSFMAQAVGTAGPSINFLYQGYRVRSSRSGGTLTVTLDRQDAILTGPNLLSTSFSYTDGNTVTIEVVRSPTGLFTLIVNSTLVGTATDTTYTTGAYIGVTQSGSEGLNAGVALSVASLQVPAAVEVSTWTSPAFDSGATPTSWQNVALTNIPSGATLTVYTAASSDNITYDAFVATTANSIVNSALKRYLKAQIQINTTLASNQNPSVSILTVGSITSSTVITMADFTGDTCYDAIQALAGMANYEFGFDTVENFFFRPKSASLIPVMAINQSLYVVDILSQTTGVERVYSSVIVTYGAYTAEIDDPGGAPGSALTTFGYNQLQPGSASFLVSADANVANGMAQTLYNFWSVIRPEIQIATTFLPQLDLSDIVTLSFHNNLPEPAWYWGDTDVYWGMPGIYYYGGNNQLLHNLRCKVVGYRIDTDDWSCEYNLEGV